MGTPQRKLENTEPCKRRLVGNNPRQDRPASIGIFVRERSISLIKHGRTPQGYPLYAPEAVGNLEAV